MLDKIDGYRVWYPSVDSSGVYFTAQSSDLTKLVVVHYSLQKKAQDQRVELQLNFLKYVYSMKGKVTNNETFLEVILDTYFGYNYLVVINLKDFTLNSIEKYFLPGNIPTRYGASSAIYFDFNRDFIVKSSVDQILFAPRAFDPFKGRVKTNYTVKRGFFVWRRGDKTQVPLTERYYPLGYNTFFVKEGSIHTNNYNWNIGSNDINLDTSPDNKLTINDS